MVNVNAPSTTTLALASAASAVLVIGLIAKLWQRRGDRAGRVRIPEKWRRVGTLTELALYPIKSGAPLFLEQGECMEIGLRTTSDNAMKLQDRSFMVTTSDGKMKTARQYSKMMFIKVSRANESSVTFQAPDLPDLTVQIPKPNVAKKIIVTMWEGEQVPGLDCGDAAAKWIHTYLGLEGLRIVYYDVDAFGKRDHSKSPFKRLMSYYPNFSRYDSGTFGDLCSYMMINAASVEDLKKRVGEGAPATLSSRWFRSNFEVSGAAPYAEDSWDLLRIGDTAVFQVNKPCTRCIITTIDPETAKKTADMEPLRTLRKYRAVTNPEQLKVESATSPCMGSYMGLRRPGVVRAGDAVYVPDE